MKYYRALKSMLASVDLITAELDFSKCPFVVAPANQSVDAYFLKHWTTRKTADI